MKLKDAIKLGVGIYIGYEIARSIDHIVVKKAILTTLKGINIEPEKNDEKVIMGFHAN